MQFCSHGNLLDVSLKSIAMCTHMEELVLHGCSHFSNGGLGLLAARYECSYFLSIFICFLDAGTLWQISLGTFLEYMFMHINFFTHANHPLRDMWHLYLIQ